MNYMKLEAMQAVYSYFFPEARVIVNGMRLPDEMFFVSTPASEAKDMLEAAGFADLAITKTLDDKIDLDMIHEPIIDEIIRSYELIAPALNMFKHRYPTSGSSQGIFHLLSELKQKGTDRIYTFSGEYEGYKEYGKCLGIQTEEIGFDDPIRNIKKGFWFISNPSAKNGNIIPDEKIIELCNAGHRMIIDLAYVGMTRPHVFSLDHENIMGVVMSMSKPYGVFRFRVGGFAFTKEPIQSLYGNKWFKDVPSLFSSLALVRSLPPGSLHTKYYGIQQEIIKSISQGIGIGMRPSDVFLLGYLNGNDSGQLSGPQKDIIAGFRRGEDYRFCLTPYFEDYERRQNSNHKTNCEVGR